MNSKVRRLIPALLLIPLLELQAQQISSFSPTFAASTDTQFVFIFGSGFNGPSLDVRFNGTRDPNAQVTAANGTVIQAHVPTGAPLGPGPIRIWTGGTTNESSDNFTVIGPGPYIDSISPSNGSAGTTVTLTGAHFSTGISSVRFNGILTTLTNVASDGTMTAKAPNGVTTGTITVSGPKGSSTSSQLFFVSPVVTGFSPGSGRANTNILMTGTNFTGATAVLFAGTNGPFTLSVVPNVLSNLALLVTAPIGVTNGQLRVLTPAGSATTTNFTVPPTIFGFTPAGGPVGTSVTITGANLNAGVPTVRFNGLASTNVTVNSFNQLTAVVRAGATTGPISITTSNGSHTNGISFYLPATITAFNPTNSAPGTTVTITGQNLLGTTNVSFNGAAANFTLPSSNTNLQVIVPTNVITGPISASTPGGTGTSTNLFYGPPMITGFTPTSGLPGTNVTITGLNLLGTSAVKFNSLNASFTPTTNNTQVRAVVPTNAQTGFITVTGPAGSATSADPFVLNYLSDLRLGLTAAPEPVFLGSNLVYSLQITNNGPLTAPDVKVTNTLPVGVALSSTTTSQGTITSSSNPIIGTLGSLAVGGTASITLTVTPQSAGTITNSAIVGSSYGDPSALNNTATAVSTVFPLPILTAQPLPPSRIRLSWPVALTNFALQFRTNLNAGTSWSVVGTAPVISGSENVVIETNNTTAKFYRLRK